MRLIEELGLETYYTNASEQPTKGFATSHKNFNTHAQQVGKVKGVYRGEMISVDGDPEILLRYAESSPLQPYHQNWCEAKHSKWKKVVDARGGAVSSKFGTVQSDGAAVTMGINDVEASVIDIDHRSADIEGLDRFSRR